MTFPTAAHFLGDSVLAEHGFQHPAQAEEASLPEAEAVTGLGWAGQGRSAGGGTFPNLVLFHTELPGEVLNIIKELGWSDSLSS